MLKIPPLSHLYISRTRPTVLALGRTSCPRSGFNLQLRIRIRRSVLCVVHPATMARTIRTVHKRIHAVKGSLTGSHSGLTVPSLGGRGGLLLADLLERHGARDNIDKELQVVNVGYSICYYGSDYVHDASEGYIQRSRYWMFRRGLRSAFTTRWPCSARYWINNSYGWLGLRIRDLVCELTVASVMTKAALLEHMLTSLSRAIIFLTRDTAIVVTVSTLC